MALFFLSLFMISYFLRLTSRFPIMGELRLDLILGSATLLVVLMQQRSNILRLNEQTSKRLSIFILYIFASIPFVTWPGSVIKLHLLDWVKVVLFYVLVVGAVRTEKQLRLLMIVFLVSQVFRILEPLYLHVTTGYWGDVAFSHTGGVMTSLNRLSGAPHDVVNPNQLAWVIVGTVPFVFYLLWPWGLKGKLLSVVVLLPSFKTLLLTGSRSGLLSLIIVFLAMVYFSKNRIKNFGMAMVLALPASIFVFGMLGADLQTRYFSLIDQSVVGGDTVTGRVEGLIRGVGSISNNPLFGNGLGTSLETNANVLGGRAQITHNLYLEVFQEVGLIGFTLFMMYIYAIIKSLMGAKYLLIYQGIYKTDWLYRFTTAVQVWIVMDLFYSLSCFGLRSWEWYFFGAVATVSLALVREQGQASVAVDVLSRR